MNYILLGFFKNDFWNFFPHFCVYCLLNLDVWLIMIYLLMLSLKTIRARFHF